MEVPTLGVEEEFLLGDGPHEAAEGLRQDTEEVLHRAADLVGEGVEHELRTGMLEAGTAVCSDLAQVLAEVVQRRAALAAAAEQVGARLLATGSHPVAPPELAGYADDDRYRRMADEFGPLADETLVCGCHVHVAVPDREVGVAVLDRIRPWLPVLVAVSANSPLWRGRDTGFDSWRTQVWSRWPTAGPASVFGDVATYEARADLLVASGVAVDRGMLYYQARLSEHWPTVEIRVADVCLAPEDAVLMGALARGLVMTAAAGGPVSDVPVELLRAATFAASRSGLRGRLVDPLTSRPLPAREVVDGLVAHIADALDAAGDRQLVVDGVDRLWADGNGADRQRTAWRRGGAPAVLDLVTVEV